MAVFVGKPLWRSLSGFSGHPRGIDLDAQFALQCYRVERTDALQATLVEFVWERAKPESWDRGYVPSDMLTFVEGSLLVHDIYLRHGVSSGQDLSLTDLTWNSGAPRAAMIRYTYHHQGRAEDYFANEWLRKAFALWVTFMQAQLALQVEAG
jgi:hypothetical protein